MIRAVGSVELPGGFRLGPLDLAFGAGERVVITGPSGGGKSTLLRTLAGFQAIRGEVSFEGRSLHALRPSERSTRVGFVSQDPLDQVIAGTAGEEVGFAIGNLPRGDALCRAAGISPDVAMSALSGGGIQRVVIAAARAAGARMLLLDEPLAWLDALAASRLLAELAETAGGGVVLAEHRTAEARRWATREVRIEGGRVVWDGAPRSEEPIGAVVRSVLPAPTIRLERRGWQVGGREVLANVSVALARGERVAVVGRNGAGKSALLQLLARDLPDALLVPQDPDLSLFAPTVARELAAAGGAVSQLAAQMGLAGHLEAPPPSLSRGQRVRLAVGAALSARPSVLLLDEPSAGQDAQSIAAVFDAIPAATTVVFATHDLALAGRVAHRVLKVAEGRVLDFEPGENSEVEEPLLGSAVTPASRLDPRIGLLLVGAVGLLAMTLDRAISLGLLAALAGLAMARAAPRWRRLGALAGVAIVWSATVSQGLFYADFPRTPWIEWPVTVWREGVQHGLVQGLRGLAPTWAGIALASAVDAARLHRALLAFGFPSGPGFLVLAGVRFAPAMAREAVEVRAARDRRVPWGLGRWQTDLHLLRPLVARAVRRARTLGDSLQARGVDLAGPPPGLPLAPLSRRAWTGVALGASGLAVILMVELATALYLAELLYVPSWRPLYAFARGWL